MGMTITEKILCAHTGHQEVRPGMLINAKVDIALGAEFRKTGAAKVFDKDKVVLVLDHFTPRKTFKVLNSEISAYCSVDMCAILLYI